MINANAKKWLAALRSDKFTQARGKLRVEDGFCCLGVACELYSEENPDAYWSTLKKLSYFNTEKEVTIKNVFLGETDVLPDQVKDWLGLQDRDGTFAEVMIDGDEAKRVNALTTLNDRLRMSLKEIADFIETEPKGLFKSEIHEETK